MHAIKTQLGCEYHYMVDIHNRVIGLYCIPTPAPAFQLWNVRSVYHPQTNLKKEGGAWDRDCTRMHLHRVITIRLNVGKFSTKRFKSANEGVTSCTYEDYVVTPDHR